MPSFPAWHFRHHYTHADLNACMADATDVSLYVSAALLHALTWQCCYWHGMLVQH
jgi:hypothetical protein